MDLSILCFLIALYIHIKNNPERLTTSLPVATDATCSGLQILAGLARDKSTARLVNVVPSHKPQDAYAVVAEVSKPYIPEKYRAVWDRKCVKRTVMTIPYNAKAYSNRSYIKSALEEKGVDVDKDDLTIIVQSVRQAMQAVVHVKRRKGIQNKTSKEIVTKKQLDKNSHRKSIANYRKVWTNGKNIRKQGKKRPRKSAK